ncbi:hypothetical protein NM208_g11542 [Fusarium decemcellulare]|uniref:Uncharacterized protein n=1 Tax=Fusarium decemcellulare TaxID=57161 RepID=A0ACC1RST4_9HYPO|nr:hypothetical protein NM208_g11542 [Fusarium decemcellulare]
MSEQGQIETRPTGTRSRLGCLTCRRRHKKCDEKRPVCRVCQKSGRECEYGSELKWAAVDNSGSFAAKHNSKKKTRGQSDTGDSSARRRLHSTHQGPTAPDQFILNVHTDQPSGESLENLSAGPTEDPVLDMWMSSAIDLSAWDNSGAAQGLSTFFDPSTEIGIPEELIPRLHDTQPDGQADNNQEIEPDAPTGSLEETGPLVSRSEACVAKSGQNPLLSTPLSSSSEEIAYTYYINYASSHIPAYDSPQNPYRKLCIVAVSYPLLLHTILYISTVSMFNYGHNNSDLITKRQSQASTLLQNAVAFLESEKRNRGQEISRRNHALSVLSLREVTLAASLMRIVTEVMSGSQAAEDYLQSAYQLMVELNYIESMPESFYARLLVQRFAIIDVVLAFLRRRKPIAPMSFVLYQQHEDMGGDEPAFRELTGCPQLVLTFLARVSHLAHDIAGFEGDNSPLLAEAYQLETEMRIWGQRYSTPLVQRVAQEAHSDNSRKYLDVLSECFYWTAQLLLARRVFLDATSSSRVQFLRKHLFNLMDQLPAGCGPDSSLPFPFYMAAREAMTTEDRDWVRRKHAEMMNMYRDRARDMMMGLTEEIWSKTDEAALASRQDLHGSLVVLENDIDLNGRFKPVINCHSSRSGDIRFVFCLFLKRKCESHLHPLPYLKMDLLLSDRKLKFRSQSWVGAKLALGSGKPFTPSGPGKGGYFMEPVVLTNMDSSVKLSCEETFGPVCGLSKFETEDEVTKLANNTSMGLASYVFSKNVDRLWNMFENSAAESPFGGIKESGYGKESGKDVAVAEYLIQKTGALTIS